MVGGERLLLSEILCQADPVGAKSPIFSNLKKQSAITSKRYEIGCQLLLITNRKSHTVF